MRQVQISASGSYEGPFFTFSIVFTDILIVDIFIFGTGFENESTLKKHSKSNKLKMDFIQIDLCYLIPKEEKINEEY